MTPADPDTKNNPGHDDAPEHDVEETLDDSHAYIPAPAPVPDPIDDAALMQACLLDAPPQTPAAAGNNNADDNGGNDENNENGGNGKAQDNEANQYDEDFNEEDEIPPGEYGFEPVAFTPATPIFGLAPVEAQRLQAEAEDRLRDEDGESEGEEDEDGQGDIDSDDSEEAEGAPAGSPGASEHPHSHQHPQPRRKRKSLRGRARVRAPREPRGRAAAHAAASPALQRLGKPAAATSPKKRDAAAVRQGANPHISAAHRRQAKLLLWLILAFLFLGCVTIGSYRLPWMINRKLIWPWNEIVRQSWFPEAILPDGYVRPGQNTPRPDNATPAPGLAAEDDSAEPAAGTGGDYQDDNSSGRLGAFEFSD